MLRKSLEPRVFVFAFGHGCFIICELRTKQSTDGVRGQRKIDGRFVLSHYPADRQVQECIHVRQVLDLEAIQTLLSSNIISSYAIGNDDAVALRYVLLDPRYKDLFANPRCQCSSTVLLETVGEKGFQLNVRLV